jgi:hypothetical protein
MSGNKKQEEPMGDEGKDAESQDVPNQPESVDKDKPDALSVAQETSERFDAHTEQMKAYTEVVDKRIESMEEQIGHMADADGGVSQESIVEAVKEYLDGTKTPTATLSTFDNSEAIIMESATRILIEIAIRTGPGNTAKVDMSPESINRAANMAKQLYDAVQRA